MPMTLVKLNKRHKAYQHGFTHAFRFDRISLNALRISDYFSRMYEYAPYNRPFSHSWCSYYGGNNITFWIAVRDEKLITMSLLAVELIENES